MLRPKKLFLAANLPVKINAATKLPQSSWKRLKSRNECIPWQDSPRFWRPSRACYGHTAQCLGGDSSGVAFEQHEVIERLRAMAVEQVQCWKFQSYFHMMSQHSGVRSAIPWYIFASSFTASFIWWVNTQLFSHSLIYFSSSFTASFIWWVNTQLFSHSLI
jgi:hypothetical protein